MSISCHPPLFSFSEDDILGFQSATRCNTVFVTLQMNNLNIFITAKTRSIICSPPYEDNEWIMPNFEEGIRLYAAMEITVSICYFTYKLLPVWLKVLINKEVLTECEAIRAPKILPGWEALSRKGLVLPC